LFRDLCHNEAQADFPTNEEKRNIRSNCVFLTVLTFYSINNSKILTMYFLKKLFHKHFENTYVVAQQNTSKQKQETTGTEETSQNLDGKTRKREGER